MQGRGINRSKIPMQSSSTTIRDYYDSAPYASYAYPECAPEQLASVACLYGLTTADLSHARILELGCSSGGNLIPTALRHPGSQAVGLDISGTHIQAGREHAARLGLRNISLQQADLMETDPEHLGQFDFIICHGLYSWIPEPVQDRMFKLCQSMLQPNGVLYVSYNTYPGWKAREIIRDAMLLHAGDQPTVAGRIAYAKAMVGFLHKVAAKGSLLEKIVDENMNIIRRTGDDYLAHDYLEPSNTPRYVDAFLAHADRYALRYLGEAEPARNNPAHYGPEIASVLASSFTDDRIRRERYMDFAINRTFRQSLLVHASAASALAHQPRRSSFRQMCIAAQLPCHQGHTRLDTSMQAYGPRQGQHLTAHHPAIKLAADMLHQAWPLTLDRKTLATRIEARLPEAFRLAPDMIDTALDELTEFLIGHGLAKIRTHAESDNSTTHPALDPMVRKQLMSMPPGERFVVNRWHESIELADSDQRVLLLLHGDAPLDARMPDLVQVLPQSELGRAQAAHAVLNILRNARANSLLTGCPADI